MQRLATVLADQLSGLPQSTQEAARTQFLLGQVRAVAARADFLNRMKHMQSGPGFDQATQSFFGIRIAPVAAERTAQFDVVRRRIDGLLGGGGKLSDRYSRFEQAFVIPEEHLKEVMERSLELCRQQTQAHMQLPPGEHVQLEYVRDKPWSGFSHYKGNLQSVLEINADLRLTVDRALQLACHEGYPGHHVFNSLTDPKLPELLVQPTFSPQSLLSEAAATVAGELAFTDTERTRIERDVLFPLAGIPTPDVEKYLMVERLVDSLHPEELSIARDYLDGRLEFVRAAAALEDRALMAHTDATLRYLNEYGTYVVTYTEGRDLVNAWLDRRAGASRDRWKAFSELIASPRLFRQ
jgi:hypothetical protein